MKQLIAMTSAALFISIMLMGCNGGDAPPGAGDTPPPNGDYEPPAPRTPPGPPDPAAGDN